jgi:hypothetical protein
VRSALGGFDHGQDRSTQELDALYEIYFRFLDAGAEHLGRG